MTKISILLLAAVLALAGCGDDDDPGASSDGPAKEGATTEAKDDGAVKKDDAAKEDAATSRKGATITVADSEFGPMLFDSRKQAIYIFENDSKGKTVCYGECAEAWPPVFANGKPTPGDGVNESLLGTVKRRDGKQQVTYAGQPLYFYAHEGRGEVRCHNVDLNGGLWWVVGPDGKRRP